MTDAPGKYPKPEGDEREVLYDAKWDLIDCHEAYIHNDTDTEKWLYWLRRYEGFAEGEIQAEIVKSFSDIAAIHITLKD